MRDKKIVDIAEKFLKSMNVRFLPKEYNLKFLDENYAEVTFLNFYALDPNYVVDPPDFKVLVNLKTLETTLVTQM